MQLSIEEAEQEFMKLLDRIEPRKVASFLDWITDSFTIVDSEHRASVGGGASKCHDMFLWTSSEVAQADAVLKKIALEMRSELRYLFTALVPLNEAMSGRLIVDVGSRLGAVLYASYLYGGGRVNAVGIEINKEFCELQEKTIKDNGMEHRVKVINDDVRYQGQLVALADVVVLNNVFNFFLPQDEQLSCWNFLHESIRGGAVIVSNPTLDKVTEHLKLPFCLDDWVTKIDTSHLAARFAGTNDELFEDCEKLTLYSVLHRTSG